MRRLAALLAISLIAAAPSAPVLPRSARATLTGYLSALRDGRYADAYALLASRERAYFKTSANFASVFTADHFVLDRYALHAVHPVGNDLLVAVGEHASFLDIVHDRTVGGNITALYGLTPEDGGYRVEDEARAWKAFDPTDVDVGNDGLELVVRKIAFYPGRVEALLTFINRGTSFVTLLPYGRSVLFDDAGEPYRLIETKLPALTDRELRLGLRLAGSAEYTGALNFETPPGGSAPHTFSLTVGPMLRDGADEPFMLQPGAIPVPQ